MSSIYAEVLISLVEAKPVLWDKTLDIYKDRIATRKAWEELCSALKPDFDSVSDAEKNSFDQLQFLNKIYTDKVTVDSLDSETGLRITLMEDEEPGGSGNEDRSTSIIEDLPSKKSSSQIGKRRDNKPDEV
ncbi:hypothetical protein FQR65_LT09483 [Abscondita terminalis]|nr:hypothetical protein FQR65_LT09483 [Abscondita terminalis]